MSELYDSEFIRKYLGGNCAKEEKEEFLNFLENPNSGDSGRLMMKVWEEAAKDHQVFLGAEEKILQKLLRQLPEMTAVTTAKPRQKTGIGFKLSERWRINYTMRYAAIILFFMVASFTLNIIGPQSAEPQFIKTLERKTHNGQHLTFQLDDGTKIHLNSKSSLSYPEVFSDTSRVVHLFGEGFFEVAHDSQRPFIVITGEVSTTALGTSFNINYHENQADISLLTGKVKVEIKESETEIESFTLNPGHELHCDLSNRDFLIDEFTTMAVAGWKDGIIYFENASLNEMKSTLEDWYDVSIQTENKKNRNLKSWSYSGKFEKQTLENVLRGMSYVEKFNYEINGKSVKLMFN